MSKALASVLSLAASLIFAQSPQTRMDIEAARALYQKVRANYLEHEAKFGRRLETRNGSIHYLEWSKTGTPFVYIPGTGGTTFEFGPFVERLTGLGFRVIAIDYYGHGHTPIPVHDVSIYDLADDINQLLTELSVQRAIICGFSRGGTLGAAFYHEYPERVSGLVMVDGGSFMWRVPYDRMTDDEVLARRSSPGEAWFETEFDLFFDAVRDRGQLNPADLSLFEILARTSQGSDGKWASNRGLYAWLQEIDGQEALNAVRRPTVANPFESSFLNFSPLQAFRNLQVPMLIIDPVSDNDTFRMTDQNVALAKAHPSLVTHLIYEDSPHRAHLARPQKFLSDLESFLKIIR